ncbi:MAG: O-antigen ligase family protein [Actinomycetota bacterium]
MSRLVGADDSLDFMERLAEVIVLGGTALLVYYTAAITQEGVNFFRSEFVYAVAIPPTLLWFMTGRRQKYTLLPSERIALPISTLSLCFFAATEFANIHYKLGFTRQGLTQLGSFLLGILMTIIVRRLVTRNNRFGSRLATAFFLPPLALLPVLVRPGLAVSVASQVSPDLVGQSRFAGLTSNPSSFALLLTIGLSFTWPLCIYWFGREQRRWGFTFLIFSLGLGGLLVTTQSRGFAAASAMIVAVGSLVGIRKFSGGGRRRSVSYLLLFGALVFGSVYIIPSRFRQGSHLANWDLSDRLFLWKFYWRLIRNNPIGYGLNYIGNFTVARPNGLHDPLPPHNSFLDMAMLGGWFAVIALLLILRRVFQSAKKSLELLDEQPHHVYTFCACLAIFAMWAAGLVEGAPFFYAGFWVLLGFALSAGAMKTATNESTPQSWMNEYQVAALR